MKSEKDITKILKNVKGSLEIEGITPSSKARQITEAYFRDEITTQEAVRLIIDNVLPNKISKEK